MNFAAACCLISHPSLLRQNASSSKHHTKKKLLIVTLIKAFLRWGYAKNAPYLQNYDIFAKNVYNYN